MKRGEVKHFKKDLYNIHFILIDEVSSRTVLAHLQQQSCRVARYSAAVHECLGYSCSRLTFISLPPPHFQKQKWNSPTVTGRDNISFGGDGGMSVPGYGETRRGDATGGGTMYADLAEIRAVANTMTFASDEQKEVRKGRGKGATETQTTHH